MKNINPISQAKTMPEIIRENILMPLCHQSECHAATLLKLNDGSFLAVWFGGLREGYRDVAIWQSRRMPSGWSSPETLIKIEYQPHWNPVLFRNQAGTIQLYFKVGAKIANWKTFIMESHDEAVTWNKPRELVPEDDSGGRGPVKNKPILLSNGEIMAPASVESGSWRAFVDISSDDGKTWTRSRIVPVPEHPVDDRFSNNCLGVIQPTLWESRPGHVHMLLRSNNGFIYRSDSCDFGRHWREIYKTSLPNNNSGLDLAKLADGRLLLIYNPSAENWGNRRKIAGIFSYDNGASWKDSFLLDEIDHDQSEHRKSEFSYPAVIPDNGGAAIIYTTHRYGFTFSLLSLDHEKIQCRS